MDSSRSFMLRCNRSLTGRNSKKTLRSISSPRLQRRNRHGDFTSSSMWFYADRDAGGAGHHPRADGDSAPDGDGREAAVTQDGMRGEAAGYRSGVAAVPFGE